MSSSRICVAVRKRPCGPDDKDIILAQSSTTCIVNEPKIKYDLTPYTERHTFIYDQVCDERTGNREVYRRCCGPLIETVFNKGNATCFAYGQTGSGKTHTMLGRGDEPGLYACAAHDIFARCKPIGAQVFASFYEIYGRKLFDLLNDRSKLVAREDGNKEIVICGLTEHRVTGIESLFQLISSGSASRAAGVTSANSESSRSHAVLQLEVKDASGKKSIGKISFIDLAGNERGADTFDCDRKTRMEGAEINKSLLALKECIRALGMGKNHVPFRGSVLTEVLRDSFLGNSRTTMIATISPTEAHCDNTINTLRYTQRVKDFVGPSGGGKEQIIMEERPKRNADPRAQRRRAAPEPARPEWVDDFAEDKPLENDPPPAPKRKISNGVRPTRQKVAVKDPRIATIVENHLKHSDDDFTPTDEDDEQGEPEVRQVRAAHAHVVREITRAEDEIMAVHRTHIDFKMSGIKEEIKAIQSLEDRDSVDDYVTKVKEILGKQRGEIDSLMCKLNKLQQMLTEEEDLSRTFQPKSKGGFKPNYGY